MKKISLDKLCTYFAAILLPMLVASCGGEAGRNVDGVSNTVSMAGAPTENATAIFTGNRENYAIVKTETGYLVTDKIGADGTRNLNGINTIKFADVVLNLTIADKAKTINIKDLNRISELYVAFFNRVPDADGLAYWIEQFKAGSSIEKISESFYQAAVLYPVETGYSSTMSNTEFVKIIYKNVLGRFGSTAPPDADVQYWAGELANGHATKGKLVGTMLDSAHTFKGHVTWDWVSKLLDNKILVANYFSVKQGINYLTPQESILRGGEIARAVTSVDTEAAKNLIGINDNSFDLSDTGVATVSGRVIDGYLQGVSVFWDCNENKIKDQSETEVISMSGGLFTIPKSNNPQCKLIAEVKPYSIDEDTGTAVGASYQMYPLPSDATKQNGLIHITPLTSLVHLGIATNETLAEALIKEALGTKYASNVDVISLNSQAGAVHQANVNRLVAKLLQSSQSVRNTSNATESRKALGVLYQAALSSKTLSSDFHLTQSEVTYEMLKADTINPINTSLISQDISIAIDSGVLVNTGNGAMGVGASAPKASASMPSKGMSGYAPPSGRSLTEAQLKYLSDLVLYDADVRLATKAGTVIWSQVPVKKLATINGELRKLNFYSENDAEVIRIRADRLKSVQQMNASYDTELFDQFYTTKDAHFAKRFWDQIEFQTKAIIDDGAGKNALFLATQAVNLFVGLAKARTTVSYVKSRFNLAIWGNTDKRKVFFAKRRYVWKLLETTFQGAQCLNVSAKWDSFESNNLDDPDELANLLLETSDCLLDLIGGIVSKKTKSLYTTTDAVPIITANGFWETTAAYAGFVDDVSEIFSNNRFAARIEGGAEAIKALADTGVEAIRWSESFSKKAVINQDAILDRFYKAIDFLFRQSAAQETDWALRNIFVPANSQAAVSCVSPAVKVLNSCLQPQPQVEFGNVNFKVTAGESFSFYISVLRGKLPASVHVDIVGFQCVAAIRLVSHFEQACLSTTLGTYDVYVKYTKENSNTALVLDTVSNFLQVNSEIAVKIGTVTVEAKKTTNKAPTLASLSTSVEKADIKVNVNIQDADSQKLRMLMVDVSGDNGTTYSCSQQFSSLALGMQTVFVRPSATEGCKSLFIDSGKTSFRVRVYAIDETNLPSGYAYSDIGYVNQVPKISNLSVVQNSDGSVTAFFMPSDLENTLMGIDAYLSNPGATSYNSKSKQSLNGLTSATRYSVTWNRAEAEKLLIAKNTYAVAIDVFDSSRQSSRQISGSFIRSSFDVVIPTPCDFPKVLEGGVCVLPTPTCTPPKVIESGVCVTPTPICILPKVLQNGVCVAPPNTAPIITMFNVVTPVIVGQNLNGSFNITDNDNNPVTNLRVHVSRTYNGSDCVMDVGSYSSLQPTGNKTFAGCSSMTGTIGTLYLKVEARDSVGLQAEVARFVLTVAPSDKNETVPNSIFPANSSVIVGDTWKLVVTTTVPAASVNIQFGNDALIRFEKNSETQFTYTQKFSAPGIVSFKIRTVYQKSPAESYAGSVEVQKPIPVALVPVLSKSDTVEAFSPWSASLRTNASIYSADLVFSSGRRIPFDGNDTEWSTRAINTSFSEVGRFPYELQIRREIGGKLEVFPGGVLQVTERPVPQNQITITSPSSVEQGKPYNLKVQTSVAADKVTVLWPDEAREMGFRPPNDTRTLWEFGDYLFLNSKIINYIVRTYKDGYVTPTGEIRGTLQVTVAAPSIRLNYISSNIIKGESPFFSVQASLSVAKVGVKFGKATEVMLINTGGGGGTDQHFRAQVPALEAGSAIPYVITAYNAQGQTIGNALTGTVAVTDVGDSLKGASPVPAEILRGEAIEWKFVTNKAPDESWMEFSAPIGRVNLTGQFFRHTFNYAPGNYDYKLMRRDYLGNVFAIQGASGVLRISNVQASPQFTSASANGQQITQGATINFRANELLKIDVRTSQTAAKMYVLVKEISWDRDLGTNDRLQWNTTMAGIPKGTYSAMLYLKDWNDQALTSPAPINFTMIVKD